MLYTISMIPYANMAPYRQLGPPVGCRWAQYTPKQSSVALKEGKVLAAAAPVGDIPWLNEYVDNLDSFGVAANGKVKSVLLISDTPFDELRAPLTIQVTDQSATSVRLLFLLLGYRHGFEHLPLLAAKGERANASLVIGDEALTKARAGGNAFVTDLATEWYRAKQLPVVFARWVIRKDAPAEVRDSMLHWLNTLKTDDDLLVRESAPAEATRLGISTADMIDYLSGIKRVLGQQEIDAQNVFLDELAKHDRTPLFEPSSKIEI